MAKGGMCLCLVSATNAVADTGGWAYAAGNNEYGQLADKSYTTRPTPERCWGATFFVKAVVVGASHSVMLRPDGTVGVAGNNSHGELGIGAFTPSRDSGFRAVSGLSGVTAIAAGSSHSLALKSDGTVWAWGNNGNGELGVGAGVGAQSAPVRVSGEVGASALDGIVAIAAGGTFSLALKDDGGVLAWGSNESGQLGNGSTTESLTPSRVSGLTDVVAIACGFNFGLAVKGDGTVRAWGSNVFGELGDGTTIDRWTPVQVQGLSDITAVAGGDNFGLAVKRDGTVWAWGGNLNPMLLGGTAPYSWTPVQVLGKDGVGVLNEVTAVAAGSFYGLAVRSDGSAWAWGYNDNGALGDGTTMNHATPVQVVGLSHVTAVAAGSSDSHSLFLVEPTYYRDADHDGFGDPNAPLLSPTPAPPVNYVVGNTDCDDGDASVHKDCGTLVSGGSGSGGGCGGFSAGSAALLPLMVMGLVSMKGRRRWRQIRNRAEE